MQASHGVGPRRKAVPYLVQVFALFIAQSSQTKLLNDGVENHAVQAIDVHPGQFTFAHAVHGRRVPCAPGIGKRQSIHLNVQVLGDQCDFACNTAAPVYNRAKNIKCKRFDSAGCVTHPCLLKVPPKLIVFGAVLSYDCI